MIELKPLLRFDCFNESWTKGNLKDTLILKYGKDHKHLKNGNYPVLGSGGVMRYVDSFLCDKPSVLIGRKGTIDNPLYINKPFWTVDTLFYTEIRDNFIPYFIYLLAQKVKWKKYNEATGVPSLNTSSIYSIPVIFPDKIEQQKIANFLTSVDTKISHLTEKHRLLKDYKKGVMQQIFSQKIRFKDDDGSAFPDWKEKVIGDVMTESRIKGNSGDIAKKLTVKIWGKGVIPKKDDSKGSENTQYYKRKAGQFIYGKLDFLNCAFAIIPDELDGYESTLDLPSLDVSSLVNKFFVLEVVKQKRFYKRFGEIADGSRKAKRINVGVFQEMPITLPSKAEQNKIMAFLDSLDKKTNAVNEQIEQTKLFKKGLLQQMFV
ncbi:restriction endonuclease subunit S [Pseudoalteromonas sp. S558]|uniref:restriction endonuclease subunit S n=1 Tax=Pseudoalteromonas sp. S558 TaxID=2066515 RepID=UPI00110ABE36|nr:restriction endonuclease subunit S [Pseudoalteromonas sp. S558]TMO06404.1 restriction endonuclease subunit S [Pseudoalteromonas sp. S558]